MKCAKGKKKKMEEVKKGDDIEENKSDGSVQIPEELE
ncbi:unnamed protein product, partial [Anisakis simplex]|uniref:Uncharacterized protein n=1 Tax=Anisakis simplex TaxID=6269 RepID=A0A0M3KKR8_ANISI